MVTKKDILFDYFKSNKLTTALTVVVSLLSNVFSIVIPVSIGKFYNLVFGLNAQRSKMLDFLPSAFWDTVPHFLTFFMVLVMLKVIFDFAQRYQVAGMGEKLLMDIRNMLFKAQLDIPMQVYDEKGTGKYLLRHSGDLKSVQNYVAKGIIGFTVDVILLCLVLLTLALLDKDLLIILLISLPFAGVTIIFLNRSLHSKSLTQRNYKSGLLSFVNITLRSMLSIKAFNRTVPEMNRYEKRSERVYRVSMKYHAIRSAVMAVAPGLFYTILFSILCYVYYQQQSGLPSLDAGALLTAILLLITSMPVFRRLLRVSTFWELGNISFDKLIKVLHLAENDEAFSSELKLVEGRIVFNGVSFQYPGSVKSVLLIDQVIHPGQTTLIRGSAGAGKTTMIKLLTGLYSPRTGKITIDHQDLSTVTRKSIRKAMAIVSEDWPLLGKTVFQAISYSRKVEKRALAENMLDAVQQHLPENLKLSLDSKIGDLGAGLSKGQHKLLAYARALLTEKPILIIDSPFHGLDRATQRHIAGLINGLRGKKTVIVFDQLDQERLLDFDRFISMEEPVEFSAQSRKKSHVNNN